MVDREFMSDRIVDNNMIDNDSLFCKTILSVLKYGITGNTH